MTQTVLNEDALYPSLVFFFSSLTHDTNRLPEGRTQAPLPTSVAVPLVTFGGTVVGSLWCHQRAKYTALPWGGEESPTSIR